MLQIKQPVTWHDGKKHSLGQILKHDPPVKGVVRNKRGLYEITQEYGVELESGTEITKLDKELFDIITPYCLNPFYIVTRIERFFA